ncbi:MAG: hypothetical protein RL026_2558 [Pseudomonadota bacterium]|jgi:ketosteroid isomerase-like protein
MHLRLLLTFLALLSPSLPTAVAATAGETEAVIRALEQEQAEAAAARDRNRLEALFAPEFRVINPAGGVGTRDELLALLTGSGPAPYASARYVTDTVTVYGDTVLSVGMDLVTPNQGPGAGQTVRRRVTQVWRRDGAAWRLVLRHANVITAP